MIDLSAACTSATQKRYLIGIPFLLLMALLLPVLLILAPIALIACLVLRIDAWETARVTWGVLTALRGTHVEIAKRDRSVLIHLS